LNLYITDNVRWVYENNDIFMFRNIVSALYCVFVFQIRIKRSTPVEYKYFPNVVFTILQMHTSLALMFI